MAWAEFRKTKTGTAKRFNEKLGVWETGSWYAVGRAPDGTRISEPAGAKSGPGFKVARDKVEAIENGTAQSATTLSMAFKSYKKIVEESGWAKSSVFSYLCSMDKLVDYFKDIELSDITKKSMGGFRSHLLETHKINGVFSIMGPIKAFFSYCVESGWIETSPAVAIMKGIKPVKVATYLNNEQVISILNCIDNPLYVKIQSHREGCRDDLRAIIQTVLLTGFRVGDIEKFKCSWLVEGLIYVQNGKGNKARPVPASQRLLSILAPYLARNQEFVFEGWDKNRIGNYWQYLYKRAKKHFPFLPKRCRFHDLRHTFARNFLLRGGNPKKLQVILGHASIATTLDIYGDIDGTDLGADMERVADGFLEPKMEVVG